MCIRVVLLFNQPMVVNHGNVFALIPTNRPLNQPNGSILASISLLIQKLAVADGNFYGIAPEKYDLRIFHLSMDGNELVPIQEVPAFKREMLSNELVTAIAEAEEIYLPDDMEKDTTLTKALRSIAVRARARGFAVSCEIFTLNTSDRFSNGNPAIRNGLTQD